MTTWLELHQEMPRHKKILVLARLLKVDRRYAVGIMIDLWTWSLDNADSDGNLSGMTADDIEMALDWPAKKSGELIAALLKAKLLENKDGTFALHDWADYAGKLSEQREIKRIQDRERQSKRRRKIQKSDALKEDASRTCHTPVTRDNAENVTQKGCDVTHLSHENRGDYPTVPDRTVPDLKEPVLRPLGNHTLSDSARDADAGDFEEVQKAFFGKIKAEPSALDERGLAQLLLAHGKAAVLAAIDEAADRHGHSVNYIKAMLENGSKPAGMKAKAAAPDLSDPERYKKFAKGSAAP